MVLTTQTSLAIQCPRCGELEFHALSLFSFAGKKKRVNFFCRCGEALLSVGSRDGKRFSLSFHCAYCGKLHYLPLRRKGIWGKTELPLFCPEMEVAAGFIGPKQKITQACQEREKSIGQLAAELGYEEEFDNPEVMLNLLDHLHRLAKKGKLGCRCGNRNLFFELLPDQIELCCDHCEAVGVIFGETAENIRIFERITQISLQENETTWLNRTERGHLARINEDE